MRTWCEQQPERRQRPRRWAPRCSSAAADGPSRQDRWSCTAANVVDRVTETVTVRYWAGARAAAGVDEERSTAGRDRRRRPGRGSSAAHPALEPSCAGVLGARRWPRERRRRPGAGRTRSSRCSRPSPGDDAGGCRSDGRPRMRPDAVSEPARRAVDDAESRAARAPAHRRRGTRAPRPPRCRAKEPVLPALATASPSRTARRARRPAVAGACSPTPCCWRSRPGLGRHRRRLGLARRCWVVEPVRLLARDRRHRRARARGGGRHHRRALPAQRARASWPWSSGSLMFGHQMVRRDGRPRLTESIGITSLGIAVAALGAAWMPLSAPIGGADIAVHRLRVDRASASLADLVRRVAQAPPVDAAARDAARRRLGGCRRAWSRSPEVGLGRPWSAFLCAGRLARDPPGALRSCRRPSVRGQRRRPRQPRCSCRPYRPTACARILVG